MWIFHAFPPPPVCLVSLFLNFRLYWMACRQMNANCIHYLLLYHKFSPDSAVLKRGTFIIPYNLIIICYYTLSHHFHGLAIWVHLSWVPWLSLSQAAIRVSECSLLSLLVEDLLPCLFMWPTTVFSPSFLALFFLLKISGQPVPPWRATWSTWLFPLFSRFSLVFSNFSLTSLGVLFNYLFI